MAGARPCNGTGSGLDSQNQALDAARRKKKVPSAEYSVLGTARLIRGTPFRLLNTDAGRPVVNLRVGGVAEACSPDG
jgi:hypothetical protein